jgi:hypothetical protein
VGENPDKLGKGAVVGLFYIRGKDAGGELVMLQVV